SFDDVEIAEIRQVIGIPGQHPADDNGSPDAHHQGETGQPSQPSGSAGLASPAGALFSGGLLRGGTRRSGHKAVNSDGSRSGRQAGVGRSPSQGRGVAADYVLFRATRVDAE